MVLKASSFRSRDRWAAALVTLAFALSACAHSSAHTAVSPPVGQVQSTGTSEVTPDWKDPLNGGGGGVAVSSEDAAVQDLSFSPIFPKGFNPDAIFVSDPTALPTDLRGVAYRVNDPQAGLFWIEEEATQGTNAGVLALASQCDPNQGCEGQFSDINLGNQQMALLIVGPVATSVLWVQSGVLITVEGPAASFTGDAATAAATNFVQEAAAA